MSYVHIPHTETLPSARERVAKLRSLTEATLQGAGKGWTDHGAQRLFILDVVDILLDAMKHGPDNPIVRDIPGRSQMQEQSPPEGFPHTGLPPGMTGLHNTLDGKPAYPEVTKDVLFAVGNSVIIGPVPQSHVHLCLTGRIATILEVEEWQEWMKEPWYRMRCTGEDGYGRSEGSLPQSALRLQFG